MREIERIQLELVRIGKRRADLANKIAHKKSSSTSHEEKLAREHNIAKKKMEDHQKRLLRTRQRTERRIRAQVASQHRVTAAAQQAAEYDFFICHASEDKDAIVRPLVETLLSRGKNVWYDEFVLRVGMSLRRSIDQGLANSKFGVVIIFEKLLWEGMA